MIIGSERKDLEDRFAENSREALDNSKALREIENAILELLSMDVNILLKDDILIKTLSNSRVAEE